MPDDISGFDRRLLVRAPTEKDASLARILLEQAGIGCCFCADMSQLCAELVSGAAAVLVAEEAVLQDSEDCLARWIAAQPPWSDLPILVLARRGAESSTVARAMDLLGNVTVLERPTRVATLVSAVRTALRARHRQYQIRQHLFEQERDEEILRTSHRRKDEFLAILAHELRNPLAPIRNALHILQLDPGNERTVEQLGAMMQRQVNHLVRLVDDLMEVSRISQGKIELRKEQVEVADIVRSAVETSRPWIDDAQQVLTTAIPETPLILEADPVRLAQVVSNLLNNASKYTEVGGRIWLTVVHDGDDVTLSVRDTGSGIPVHMLSHVFELFTPVDPVAAHGKGGLGIGLTLVKNLVELHGGSVRALSDGPGTGSDFAVRLPLAASPRPLVPSRAGGRPAAFLPRHRLLVVDDNRDAADSIGLLLGLLGAEVEVVYDGPAALSALETFRPFAILLDIGMPGMDGHEVAQRIRRNPEHDPVKLIALTGWGQKEDVLRTQESGCDYHLIKPLDIKTLEKLLTSIDFDSATSASSTAPAAGTRVS